MATPEFRWPITAMMSLSAMMFLALATPTSGLAWSSKGTSSTLYPIFSRLPLSFSTASCAPSLMPSPSAACPPDSGLCEAILMVPLDWASTGCAAGSASAATVTATARALSTWRNRKVLIRCPPQNGSAKCASGAIIAGLPGSSTGRRQPLGIRACADALGQKRLQLTLRLGIGGLDGQRFVKQGHGYQCPARPLLLRRTGGQGQDVVGGQVDESRVLGKGLAIVRQRLRVPALLRVHRAQVRQRGREVGLEPQREMQHVLRFPVLALSVERRRDVACEVRAARTERESPTEGNLRLRVAVLAEEGCAEVVPAAGAVGIDVDRPHPQRLGVLPDLGLIPGAESQHEHHRGRAGERASDDDGAH